MKYIRTEHTIFEVVSETDIVYKVKAKFNSSFEYSKSKSQTKVIKSSETLDELIDEYVAVGIPFRNFIVDLKELKRSGLDIHSFSRACHMQYKNCAIYGAIYTKKGLIYVTEINERGESKLL